MTKPEKVAADERPIATASGVLVYCRHDSLAALSELKPNPRNPNTHPPEQVGLLAKIINEQGWRAPIIISKRSGFIVAGHCRRLAALSLGVTDVPVEFQDFASDTDEWAHLLADNRMAELAENDRAILKYLLGELDTGAIDMELTGYDDATIEAMMTAEHREPRISELDRPPPKMAWVLIGIELGRFGEISKWAEEAAQVHDSVVIVCANDAT
jgi:ParB-like chromosome segregation protein Spo0J